MNTIIVRFTVLTVLLAGLCQPVNAARADLPQASQNELTSPVELLNADGTLKLNGTFNGSLDISGYSVALDPVRGPVFGVEGSAEFSSAASVTAGNWAAIGDGGGVVNGFVRAILVNGTDVYIGGDFTDLANIPEADYIAKWDGSNWSALGSDGRGEGSLGSSVNALALIGSNLYAGGSFVQVYNNITAVNEAAYIAKWDIASSNWSALGSNGAGGSSLNSNVTSLAVSGSTLYVGGGFTNVNNSGTVLNTADHVAQWDGTNWSALGSNGAGDGSFGVSAYIGDLVASGSDLYVGGQFTDVNNNATVLTAGDNIVKWDGANWSALSSNGSGNGSISGTVYALAISGSDLYVGGQFTNVNNNGLVLTAGDYLVKWDGANWSALGSNGAGNGSLNSYPLALLVNGTDLFVGGGFTNVNNNGSALNTADYVAKWDGSNWSALGSNGSGNGAITPKLDAFVFALGLQGSDLFTGGFFYDINNGGTVLPQADYLAKWDGSNWSSVSSDANGALVNGYSGSQVYAIAVSGTDIYVGGRFIDVSNHGLNIPEADYIVKWDGANWSALGSDGAGDGSLKGIVYALAVNGTDLYVGGTFKNVRNGGVTLSAADYVAKWDGMNWSALGSNGSSDGAIPDGTNTSVSSFLVKGTDLYVGGTFTNLNNNGVVIPEADHIAKWDGMNWSALGSNGSGDGALNGYVGAIAVDSADRIYVGGGFTNAASVKEADYIAAWDGANWSALGNNGTENGSLNNGVNAIAIMGTTVYAGGYFTNVNNNGNVLPTADLIAKWNGSDWSALGSNGLGDSIFCVPCGNSIRAIYINGTDVYVGGSFEDVRSNGVILNAADKIAKWDGSTWSALGSNGAGNGSIKTTYGVYAITTNGSDLLVGGLFSNVNNNGTVLKEADYLAAYGMTVSAPDLTPPTVVSITRANANPTSAASVDFNVTFSEDIYFPWPTVFVVTQNGVSGAAVTGWSGSGSSYVFHVHTGSGNGTIRLDVVDDDTIVDAANNPLGGAGANNGGYTSGESYTVDKGSAPTDITLSASSVTENLPGGTVVGSFASTDPDPGDTYTYSLVSGTGSDDNAAFSISGNSLHTVHPFNYLNKNSYSIRVRSTDSGGFNFEKAISITIADSPPIFADVPDSYWAVSFIERLYNAGITGGCSMNPLNYCPESTVTRAQMAVFLLKGIHGSSYAPPAVGASTGFNDVATDYWAAAWIKQLAAESITGGCGGGLYCPDNPVTRAQMAVFLLKAKYGSSYIPPAIGSDSGFTDVAVDYWAAAWIKQLAAEGITSGCASGLYCPETAVNRAQMAVFLVKAFSLP